MSRPIPSNFLVRLLTIKGQVSLAVEQHSILTQDRLAFRKNFRAMANLAEASGAPNSVKDYIGRSAPALASSPALECISSRGSTSVIHW